MSAPHVPVATEGAAAAADAPHPVSLGRSAVALILAGGFLLASVLVGISAGPVHLGVGSIVDAAAAHLPLLQVHSPLSGPDEAILWQLRAPRVVLACLVGGMLAVAGASYQGVLRNPLADPYLLGIAAGAGLGATLAIAYGHGSFASYDLLPLAAFVGAAAGVAAAYALGRSVGPGRSPATLILAGVTITSFLTALQTFVQQQRSETLRETYSWLLGRLDTSGWRDVTLVLPYVAVSVVALLLHRRLLDVLSVGDEEAAALGVNVGRVRLTVVVFATIGTAAAVAISGLIGFVGIIVPHAMRLLVGPSYRLLLPLSLLVGAGFLVCTDMLARTVMAPAELPIGVVTAFFGAPFFAVVLRTTRMVGS
jgi:iron complex transport system permease protein